MKIQIIKEPISLDEVKMLAKEGYGDLVKAVSDIDKRIMTLGGEWHADGEQILLQEGSLQDSLWGFNIYPEKSKDIWLEYYSLINIRPSLNNRSYEIQDDSIKRKIKEIVDALVL